MNDCTKGFNHLQDLKLSTAKQQNCIMISLLHFRYHYSVNFFHIIYHFWYNLGDTLIEQSYGSCFKRKFLTNLQCRCNLWLCDCACCQCWLLYCAQPANLPELFVSLLNVSRNRFGKCWKSWQKNNTFSLVVDFRC